VRALILTLALLVAPACRPAADGGASDDRRPATQAVQRTLVMLNRLEPPTFARKALEILGTGTATAATTAPLNAELVRLDEQGFPQPYLAEALPLLQTDTWRVFPDGTMETIYGLRPNLLWHDGQPLTAEDFVFSWRVYATPEFGVSQARGFRSIEEVTAPDPRTLLIRWKDSYIDAGAITTVLPPLPRHILEQPFRESPGTFAGLSFWTDEYIGAGPWKLERREPGAFFEMSAFDGFVFGRPRMDRIRMIYQTDVNIAVATMLAGEAHYAQDLLRGEDGVILEQAWDHSKAGTVHWLTFLAKGHDVQQRPEFAVPTQLATDVRVRQALVFTMDRVTLAGIVTAGHGLFREIFTHPNADYYETLLRAATARYPYDPRRAEQLLREAGFTRGADAGWLTPTGERFTLESSYLTSATNERDSQILVDGFRRFGIDASSNLFGVTRTSQEERAKVSGLFGGNIDLDTKYHSRDIARAENRWTGANRYGFSNADFDRLTDAFLTSLDRSERIQALAEMERIGMERLPGIPTYWAAQVVAHTASLKGVSLPRVPEGGHGPMWTWEWQS